MYLLATGVQISKKPWLKDCTIFLTSWDSELFLTARSQDIEDGDLFPSAIKDAISSASVQVVIFSKGYADSAWCLAELDFMYQIRSKIILGFYDVAPRDPPYIEKAVYAKAFVYPDDKQRRLHKLQRWKEALHYVSFLNGYGLSNYNDEDELCKNIASSVWKKVEKKRFLSGLEIAADLINSWKILKDVACRKEKTTSMEWEDLEKSDKNIIQPQDPYYNGK